MFAPHCYICTLSCLACLFFSRRTGGKVPKIRFDASGRISVAEKYTNGTKKRRDFKIVADNQEWSKIQNYADIYVI